MIRLKIPARTLFALTLILSLTLLKACGVSNQINTGEVYSISLSGKDGQEADKVQEKKGLSDTDRTAKDQYENRSDTVKCPTERDEYSKLRELIKEAIDNRSNGCIEFNNVTYSIIEVDGGDLSGERKALVAVDIGYGEREYWAFTNEYGQLVFVYADRLIPQDEENEPVTSNGRYYNDEAKVPGTELEDMDEGHVIADSLGGVSNAYNITPQNSVLNRHGNQAYMEKVIRDAGGCEKFFAVITYPDANTQIPSHYHYEYILNGEDIVDEFDNVDPDKINVRIILEDKTGQDANDIKKKEEQELSDEHDLSKVDKNGDGRVTIAEARAAGYRMPIYSDHWLYPYMDDRDGDGMVGE